MVFVGKGYSQNLQNFIGTTFKPHILLNYGNKTVSDDSAVNLDSDSVLCSTPKFFNFEMLLEPLEE